MKNFWFWHLLRGILGWALALAVGTGFTLFILGDNFPNFGWNDAFAITIAGYLLHLVYKQYDEFIEFQQKQLKAHHEAKEVKERRRKLAEYLSDKK